MPSPSHLLVALCLALLPAIAPRAQSVTGAWAVEYEQHIRESPSGTTIEKGRARLLLDSRGDSVVGTWQPVADGGAAAPAVRELRGVVDGDTVRLTTPVQLRRSVDGAESVLHGTMVYEFVVDGDALRGRIRTVVKGVEGRPRAFVATRERAP